MSPVQFRPTPNGGKMKRGEDCDIIDYECHSGKNSVGTIIILIINVILSPVFFIINKIKEFKGVK